MTLSAEQIAIVQEAYGRLGSLRAVKRELGRHSLATVKKYASQVHEVRENNLVRGLRTDDDLLIGTYVGLWMGDGTQFVEHWCYRIKICTDSRNDELNDFIRWAILQLFGKRSTLATEKGNHKGYVRFCSKYIFTFVDRYATYEENKTHTVRLRSPISSHSRKFLEGCLLGLFLSDGSLIDQARFNVTSARLAQNITEILVLLGFAPRKYVQNRERYGWHDLHMVYLGRRESRRLRTVLDRILQEVGYSQDFDTIKY